MFNKPSNILAFIGWASVFIESWLMLLKIIKPDVMTWLFFVMFFIVGLFASVVGKPKKDGIITPDDLIVKAGKIILTVDNGLLLAGPERTDGKMVIIIQEDKL